MYGKQHQTMMWMEAIAEDPEIPAWKSLDIVTRKWAVMSEYEKDAEFYDRLREISQKTRPKWQD